MVWLCGTKTFWLHGWSVVGGGGWWLDVCWRIYKDNKELKEIVGQCGDKAYDVTWLNGDYKPWWAKFQKILLYLSPSSWSRRELMDWDSFLYVLLMLVVAVICSCIFSHPFLMGGKMHSSSIIIFELMFAFSFSIFGRQKTKNAYGTEGVWPLHTGIYKNKKNQEYRILSSPSEDLWPRMISSGWSE